MRGKFIVVGAFRHLVSHRDLRFDGIRYVFWDTMWRSRRS